jgi:hypothetical protein
VSFLGAVGRYVAQEVLQHLGKKALEEGRRLYADELARGVPQGLAARKAATLLLRRAVEQGVVSAREAGGKAGGVVRTVAGNVAGTLAAKGSDAARLGSGVAKQGGDALKQGADAVKKGAEAISSKLRKG